MHRLGLILIFIYTFIWAKSPTEGRGNIFTANNTLVATNTETEQRHYPQGDSLEPLLGVSDSEMHGYFGIEASSNGILQNHGDIYLTIALPLQKHIESILDSYKTSLQADEVMAAVMESKTGKVLALASSNRYHPAHIRQKDIPSLVPKFSSYPFEPGAVVMPLVMAAALERGYVDTSTQLDIGNGQFALEDGHTLKDAVNSSPLALSDILKEYSRVAITKISYLFSGVEFRQSLESFGLGKVSNIWLPKDSTGHFNTSATYTQSTKRSNSACGYGMTATFTQLLKAYNLFNSDGVRLSPRLVEKVVDTKGEAYIIPPLAQEQAISKKVADEMKAILIDNIEHGTALSNAKIKGLEVGAMADEAYIAKDGKYMREYRTSFYGFVNDNQGHKYTVGIVALRPMVNKMFYASRSVVPVFREMMEVMRNEECGLLKLGKKKIY